MDVVALPPNWAIARAGNVGANSPVMVKGPAHKRGCAMGLRDKRGLVPFVSQMVRATRSSSVRGHRCRHQRRRPSRHQCRRQPRHQHQCRCPSRRPSRHQRRRPSRRPSRHRSRAHVVGNCALPSVQGYCIEGLARSNALRVSAGSLRAHSRSIASVVCAPRP